MTDRTQVVSIPPSTSPLDAFTGLIVPTKTGLLYKVGLAVVALAMVLLPVLYVGLIAFAAWAVVYHLMNEVFAKPRFIDFLRGKIERATG